MMTEEYKEEYKKARKAAMKQYRTCASRGWSLYPPVLDEVSAYVKTAGEEVLGEMEDVYKRQLWNSKGKFLSVIKP